MKLPRTRADYCADGIDTESGPWNSRTRATRYPRGPASLNSRSSQLFAARERRRIDVVVNNSARVSSSPRGTRRRRASSRGRFFDSRVLLATREIRKGKIEKENTSALLLALLLIASVWKIKVLRAHSALSGIALRWRGK